MKKYVRPEMDIDVFVDDAGLFYEASPCSNPGEGNYDIPSVGCGWEDLMNGQSFGDLFQECVNDNPYARD